MRILGIVASAFSAVVQKIYSWSNSFGSGVVGVDQNIAGFHGASSQYKYVFAGDQGPIRRYNFLNTGHASVGNSLTLNGSDRQATVGVSNGQTMIIACGKDTARSPYLFHSNTNSDAWTEIADGGSSDRKAGIWDSVNNRFLIISNSSTSSRLSIVTGSENTWSSSLQPQVTNVRMNDIGFNQSASSPVYMFVPISTSASVYTATSLGSTSWSTSQVVASGTRSFRSIAYGNGIWVLTAGNITSYYTSIDNGATWQLNSLPIASTYVDSQSKVRFINNRFVMALRTITSPHSMYIATSTDGLTWQTSDALSVTGITAAFDWDYSPTDDVFFAATSDVANTPSGSLYIVRGL